ncbi:MAG: hypothetical protein ABI287_03905 [Rhodanobacter sp.]
MAVVFSGLAIGHFLSVGSVPAVASFIAIAGLLGITVVSECGRATHGSSLERVST